MADQHGIHGWIYGGYGPSTNLPGEGMGVITEATNTIVRIGCWGG
jgi:hypothetical protein